MPKLPYYFPTDLNSIEIPKTYVWKHYVENKYIKFEIDYPGYAVPSPEDSVSHDDIDSYSVMFGKEVEVSIMHSRFKNIDDFLSDWENNSTTDLFVKKTKVDGYDALAIVGRNFLDNSIDSDYRIYFMAYGRLYTIWFFQPLNDKRIISSFKVLK